MSLFTFKPFARRPARRRREASRRPNPAYILAFLAISLFFAGCAALPANIKPVKPTADFNPRETRLGRHFQKAFDAHPELSGSLVLYDPFDAYVARALMLNTADRRIDLQYYIYHEDSTGKLIKNELLKAADRGVRVRILLDDLFIPGDRDPDLAALEAHPNIEVRVFNPLNRNIPSSYQIVARYREVTRRMHNKALVVDGTVAVVGGRNIGNRYFDADDDISFGDIDLLTVGPVVKDVVRSFETYWNHDLTYAMTALAADPPSAERLDRIRTEVAAAARQESQTEHGQALTGSHFAETFRTNKLALHWGMAKVISDPPDKARREVAWSDDLLAAGLSPHFDDLRSEVIIVTPYFIPGREGLASLKRLVDRGVRVRLLTNSLTSNDVLVAHAWYARYRVEILKAGIELYEVDTTFDLDRKTRNKLRLNGASRPSLHAKTFIFDRRESFVGSFNWDPRSVFLNTEIGVMVESPEMAAEMADWYDSIIRKHAFRLELRRDDQGDEAIRWVISRNGQPEIHDYEPYGNFLRHLGMLLLSLLPIESEL